MADNATSQAFRRAMRAAWGRDPVDIGVGGSIPFVSAFADSYPDAHILLTGAADPTSAAHGPNESLDLGDLRRSVLAEAVALRLLSEKTASRRGAAAPGNPSWRQPSYTATAAALARFRLRPSGAIGIRTVSETAWSARTVSGRPTDSLPNTRASPCSYEMSAYGVEACPVKAITRRGLSSLRKSSQERWTRTTARSR